MLETPHVIVGAAIAIKVVNPALSLPLAFASHLLLEKVPHWNPHINTEKNTLGKVSSKSVKIIIFDVVLALISGTLIASRYLPDTRRFAVIMAACFFAVLPDLIEAPYFFLNAKSLFFKKWIKFQKSLQADAEVFPGLMTQAATILAALWWIKI